MPSDEPGKQSSGVSARTSVDRRIELLPIRAAVVWAFAFLVVVHVGFWWPRPRALSVDEAYVSAFARRMLEGRNLPYVDAVSLRGPLYYWCAAFVTKVFGYGTWMPMRVLALGSMALTLVLGLVACRLARRPMTGAVMAVTYVALCANVFGTNHGLGANSEHLLNVFAMGALASMVFALRDRDHPDAPWIGVSSAFLMLAALCRQSGIVLALPFGLWVFAAVEGSAVPKIVRPRAYSAFVLGLAVPFAALVVRYAIAGEVHSLYYYGYEFSSAVYVRALQGAEKEQQVRAFLLGHYELLMIAASVFGWILWSPFARARTAKEALGAYARGGFSRTAALAAILSPFAANVTLRNFGHYFLQAVPWAGLLAGAIVERVLSVGGGQSARRLFFARTAILLPLIPVTWLGWVERKSDPWTTLQTLPDEVVHKGLCAFVDAHSTREDSIFIWGFDPAPYTTCDRSPASRYVFTTFPAGYVPWIDAPRPVEEARVVPGSREILLHELEERRPAVIIDSPDSMQGRSLESYPFLMRFVTGRYCKQAVPGGAKGLAAWIRKSDSACAAPPK